MTHKDKASYGSWPPYSEQRLFCAKETLIIGLFCRKWPMKIRQPMGLRHPVHEWCITHVWISYDSLVNESPWLIQRQRPTETDRNRQRQIETDRDRQSQTETDRGRQRHGWMSYDSHVKESWMSHGLLMICTWMSHGWVMGHFEFVCEGVMDALWIAYDSHVNESWMSYDSHVKDSWMSHGSLMTCTWMSHGWVMGHF